MSVRAIFETPYSVAEKGDLWEILISGYQLGVEFLVKNNADHVCAILNADYFGRDWEFEG